MVKFCQLQCVPYVEQSNKIAHCKPALVSVFHRNQSLGPATNDGYTNSMKYFIKKIALCNTVGGGEARVGRSIKLGLRA